jgi:hypothetical protein
MELIESKSILAKLMATENLTVEQRPVSTASFDVKNRILTVPILDKKISSTLYDLFMGHEVGHALFTPLEDIKEAYEARRIPPSILNVVEDSRIERKIKHKFPGLRNSFVKGYKELLDKDFFGTAGSNLNLLNFIDRINLYCKGGPAQGIKFNDEEKALLDEIESTETYQDVVIVSEKVMEYMKKVEEELQQQEEEEKKKFKTIDGDDDNSEFEEILENVDFDDFEETEDEEDSFFDDQEHKKQTKNKILEKIKSFTDEKYRQNEKQLFDEKSRGYIYGNIPKINPEECIFDYKELYSLYRKGNEDNNIHFATARGSYNKLRLELNKIVSYLVKEFELRKNADQLKRASIAKTGDLNMSKIFSYKFTEDIFKKITVVPGGKSHGLVIYLDWSGSMSVHLMSTVKQLIALTLFCKKVNIPFEVYAFTSDTVQKHNYTIPEKEGDIGFGQFCLMNIFSSRMSAADFTFAGSVVCAIAGMKRDDSVSWTFPDWFHLQSTPLNQAIVSAMEIVPHFQKKYKLQIVNTVFLTDGDSDSSRGVLISEFDRNGNKRFFAEHNGRDSALVIRDPVTKNQQIANDSYRGELTNALIRLLKERTNANVIGFYILANRDFKRRSELVYPRGTNFAKIQADFRKNKYTIVTGSSASGYDEYYLLKSDLKEDEDEDVLEVKANATTRGLVSAFTKYTGNRLNNRVVLNRFIEMIT